MGELVRALTLHRRGLGQLMLRQHGDADPLLGGESASSSSRLLRPPCSRVNFHIARLFLKKVDRDPSRPFVTSSRRQHPLPKSGHRCRFARRIVLNLLVDGLNFLHEEERPQCDKGGEMPMLPRGDCGTGPACS